MNDYIQKYGENAIQAFKKSLRMSQSLEREKQSPLKQQPHLLPKKSTSKRSLKSSLLIKRNQSQGKLAHSKSIKHSSQINQQPRKKGSSFIQGSKKPALTTNGFSHTFNKLNNNPTNAHKKKLIITQTATPKCMTPKLHINLNNRNSEYQKQAVHFLGQNKQVKDKLTQRMQRSSGKKREDKQTTSQNKHYVKRPFLVQIESRLQDVLSNAKRTLKSLSSSLSYCFEIILMNQEDYKMRKLFLLLKQTVQKVCGFGHKYRGKYNRAVQKINSLQRIQQAYLNSESFHPHKNKSKHEGQGLCHSSNKKKSSIQMIILNQNYDLRRRIHKLQKQLQYYSSQQASLMNVFGNYKNTQSQLRPGRQANVQHFDSLHKAKRTSSLSKLQKRRSSQNLFVQNHQQHQIENGLVYGVHKRLSFDPNLMQYGQGQVNRVIPPSLYSSTGSVSSKSNFYNHHNDDYHYKSNRDNDHLEELSEQEDSQNQQ